MNIKYTYFITCDGKIDGSFEGVIVESVSDGWQVGVVDGFCEVLLAEIKLRVVCSIFNLRMPKFAH